MSSRSTAQLPSRCVCGQAKAHPVHSPPRPPGLLHRLLHLAWPRWTWGHTDEVHEYVDQVEAGVTRAQVRRLRRAFERERRRAGV